MGGVKAPHLSPYTMIIKVDTREQSPLVFNDDYIEGVVRGKLNYGDYSCEHGGKVCDVFFERKSISDLFGTLGKGHDRFRREVNRCSGDGKMLVIIVEDTLTSVIKGCDHSTINGISIARTLFTMMIKHKVPFVCCSSRAEMAKYISEFYLAWAKLINKGDK